jgi:hypothetical protein
VQEVLVQPSPPVGGTLPWMRYLTTSVSGGIITVQHGDSEVSACARRAHKDTEAKMSDQFLWWGPHSHARMSCRHITRIALRSCLSSKNHCKHVRTQRRCRDDCGPLHFTRQHDTHVTGTGRAGGLYHARYIRVTRRMRLLARSGAEQWLVLIR